MIKIKIINLKLNLTRLSLILIIVIAILFIFLAIFRLTNINQPKAEIIMTNSNYTTILKDCHNNIEEYINKNVLFTGYIFRMNDFSDTQFVVARDMLVGNSQAQIVGFLCTYDNAKNFENNSWVEVKGTVTKGNYNGDIPIIKVENIKKITTPNDVFVGVPK